MADGDIVIADSATEAAPHEYVVKGAEYFAIKQVQALFTDNGAGGNWLPALEIVAPPGIVTGRYVGTSVTAGSDQEVTFHPLGSKGSGGGATTSAPAWALVARDTSQAITSGFAQTIAWTSFSTSDTSVFATTPNGASGDTLLTVKKPGLCVAMSNTAWQAFFTADNYALINGSPGLTSGPAYSVPWFDLLSNGESPPNSALKTAAPVGGTYGLTDHHRAVFPGNGSIAQGAFRLDAFQQSGVDRNIVARMTVFFWPLATGYTIGYGGT